MRLARGLFAIAVLAPIVVGGALLMACGAQWFPKCDDPQRPCPPVQPDYPPPAPFAGVRDAAADHD